MLEPPVRTLITLVIPMVTLTAHARVLRAQRYRFTVREEKRFDVTSACVRPADITHEGFFGPCACVWGGAFGTSSITVFLQVEGFQIGTEEPKTATLHILLQTNTAVISADVVLAFCTAPLLILQPPI